MQANSQRLVWLADLREIAMSAAAVNLALHDAAAQLDSPPRRPL